MPRDGSNIYHQPFPNVVDGTTIESTVYNGYTADITQDLNAPRPIVAGGTGATSAAGALAALGGETNYQQVTNYDSYTFKGGSFYSDTAATGAPVAGHWFYGTAIGTGGGNSILLEARDLSAATPFKYVRIFNGTTWGAWQLSTASDGAVAKTGDAMSGDLTISKATPSLILNKTAAAQDAGVYGKLNGNSRWLLDLGNATPETGSNAGSNFAIYRYDDAGVFIDGPFSIGRATGDASFSHNLFTSGYVQSGAGTSTGTYYFGNSGARSLNYDGTRYNFVNANVWVNNGECIGYNIGNQFRARGNSYSALIRNDDSSTYILLTNAGDPDGNFNSLRPFSITNSNGFVTMGHQVTVGGQLFANSDIVGKANVYCGYNTASSGVYYFGNTSTKYLQCDGTNFIFSSGQLTINGLLYSGGGVTSVGDLRLINTGVTNSRYIRCSPGTANLEFVNQAYTNVVASIDDSGSFSSNSGVYGRPGQGPIVLSASSLVQGSAGYVCRNGVSIGGYSPDAFNLLYTSGMNLFVNNTLLGVISVTSDYRIKQDVIDLPGMWDTVKKLRPIQYQHTDFAPLSHVRYVADLKKRKAEAKAKGEPDDIDIPNEHLFTADGVERWGFMAHELQETLTPSAATGVKDADHELQSPSAMTVIAALTKALQEAMARIEALEAR